MWNKNLQVKNVKEWKNNWKKMHKIKESYLKRINNFWNLKNYVPNSLLLGAPMGFVLAIMSVGACYEKVVINVFKNHCWAKVKK